MNHFLFIGAKDRNLRLNPFTMRLFPFFIACFPGVLSADMAKVSEHPSTFCNPLNLDYRIQPGDPLRREAADPAALYFKGDYYIFASKSGGYWWSRDFNDWTLVTPPNLPLEGYAPAVLEYDGSILFMATGGGALFRSDHPKDPLSWKKAGNVRGDTDPALFLDDNGRVYLYYGCSVGSPIMGVELDPQKGFREIGKPVALISGDEKNHGWEVQGNSNTGGMAQGAPVFRAVDRGRVDEQTRRQV